MAADLIISAPFLQPGAGPSTGVLNAELKAALKRGVNVEIVTTGQSLASLDGSALKSIRCSHRYAFSHHGGAHNRKLSARGTLNGGGPKHHPAPGYGHFGIFPAEISATQINFDKAAVQRLD
jgi:hypothetical protein